MWYDGQVSQQDCRGGAQCGGDCGQEGLWYMSTVLHVQKYCKMQSYSKQKSSGQIKDLDIAKVKQF